MDHNAFDDLIPSTRPNYTDEHVYGMTGGEAWAQFDQDFKNSNHHALDEVWEQEKRKLSPQDERAETLQEVLGVGPNAMRQVENVEAFDALTREQEARATGGAEGPDSDALKAARVGAEAGNELPLDEATRKAQGLAPERATGAHHEESPLQSPGETPSQVMPGSTDPFAPREERGGAAGDKEAPAGDTAEKPRKPTSIESSIAATPLNGKRQERFVLSGDPDFISAVQTVMQARGMMRFSREGPVVIGSNKDLMKVVQEVAKETPGMSAQHALHLETDRESFGAWGKAKAALGNALGRRDTVDIVVVGSSETMDAKLTELGSLLKRMEEDKFFGEKNADGSPLKLPIEDGKLALEGDEPVSLVGEKKLSRLVTLAKQAVEPYYRAQREEMDARNELRKTRDTQDLVKGAERGAGPSEASEQGPTSKLQKLAAVRIPEAEPLLREGAGKLQEPATDKNGKVLGSNATVALSFAKMVNEKELMQDATPAQRDSYLAAISAIAVKAADGELGDASKRLPDTAKALAERLKEVHAQDPEALTRMQARVASFAQEGHLSEAQAKAANTFLETGTLERSQATVQATAETKTAETGAAAQGAEKSGATPSPAAEPVAAKAAETVATKVPEASPAAAEVAPPVSRAEISPAQKLEQLAAAGPDALSKDKVASTLATVSSLRGESLAALDAREGNSPTQTLARLERTLETVRKGNYPADQVAQAEVLSTQLERWKKEDVSRQGGGAAGAEKVAQVRDVLATQEPAWYPERAASVAPVAEPAVKTAEQASAAESAPQGAGKPPEKETPREVAPAAEKASSAQSGEVTAERAQSAKVEARALNDMMRNPQATFTTSDKRWNRDAIKLAVERVAHLDPQAVAQLSPAERSTVASNAAWVVDKANAGKLPGLEGPAGRELVAKATEKATTIVTDVLAQDGVLMRSAAQEKSLGKADRMVEAMTERSLGRGGAKREGSHTNDPGRDSQAPREASSMASRDMSGYAKDLVHAVYKEQNMTDQYATRLLKSAAQFTPESLKSLDLQTKARAVAGMEALASAVKSGDMGNFNSLPAGVRNDTNKALSNAEKLYDALSREPGMSTELLKARNDLSPGTEKAASMGGADADLSKLDKSASVGKGASKMAPTQEEARVR